MNMATASQTLQHLPDGSRLVLGLKQVPFFMVICAVMLMSLFYVWPHIRMTQLEYQVAEEMSIRRRLLEEREKLKIEYATLKSPQRIETLAKERLQMTYPERDQMINLR